MILFYYSVITGNLCIWTDFLYLSPFCSHFPVLSFHLPCLDLRVGSSFSFLNIFIIVRSSISSLLRFLILLHDRDRSLWANFLPNIPTPPVCPFSKCCSKSAKNFDFYIFKCTIIYQYKWKLICWYSIRLFIASLRKRYVSQV